VREAACRRPAGGGGRETGELEAEEWIRVRGFGGMYICGSVLNGP
jgi:hypothetical protein